MKNIRFFIWKFSFFFSFRFKSSRCVLHCHCTEPFIIILPSSLTGIIFICSEFSLQANFFPILKTLSQFQTWARMLKRKTITVTIKEIKDITIFFCFHKVSYILLFSDIEAWVNSRAQVEGPGGRWMPQVMSQQQLWLQQQVCTSIILLKKKKKLIWEIPPRLVGRILILS